MQPQGNFIELTTSQPPHPFLPFPIWSRQCELTSVMLRFCLHLLPYDNFFLLRRDACRWTTVYFCLHVPYAHTWCEQLDPFHDNDHPDHIHRRCYVILKEWNITNSLGACKFVISSNSSWYSKKLIIRVDFSDPSLCGCKWCWVWKTSVTG